MDQALNKFVRILNVLWSLLTDHKVKKPDLNRVLCTIEILNEIFGSEIVKEVTKYIYMPSLIPSLTPALDVFKPIILSNDQYTTTTLSDHANDKCTSLLNNISYNYHTEQWEIKK